VVGVNVGKERLKRGYGLLDRVGIANLASRYPGNYREAAKRVAISRLLRDGPKIMLLMTNLVWHPGNGSKSLDVDG